MSKINREDKMSTDDMIEKVYSYRKRNPLKIRENQPLSKSLYLFLDRYPIQECLIVLETLIHSLNGTSFDKTTKKEHYKIFLRGNNTIHILVIKLDMRIKILNLIIKCGGFNKLNRVYPDIICSNEISESRN